MVDLLDRLLGMNTGARTANDQVLMLLVSMCVLRDVNHLSVVFWANAANDTVTGESWEYPEFRGFFGDLYWAVIGMRTQPIGTKFHAASAYGPEGQLNLVNGQTGTYTPTLHFTFGPATRK